MPGRPDTALRHEVRVTWGDCDPARIAYTGRLPWFALEAIDAWWEAKAGDGWFQMELDRNVGTPFVSLSMDFFSPVTPRHRLVCWVWPERLGTTSITFRVDGHQDGTHCFAMSGTSVFVEASAFRKQPPPKDLRALVEAHLPGPGDAP